MTSETTIIQLLADLIRRGIRFELVDNGTGVRLILGRRFVTDEEVSELRRHKPTLIRILRALEVTDGRIVYPPRWPSSTAEERCSKLGEIWPLN